MSGCPCGSMFFPIGSKYATNRSSTSVPLSAEIINGRIYTHPDAGNGSFIYVEGIWDNNYNYDAIDLVHNQDIFLNSEQIFITSTSTSNASTNIYPERIFICVGENVNNVQINGMIRIVVKVKDTGKVIAQKIIGESDQVTLFSKHADLATLPDQGEVKSARFPDAFSILLSGNDILERVNLFGKKLIIEFYSLCDREGACCDKLPSTIELRNRVTTISCGCPSPTTTPLPMQMPLPEIEYHIAGKDEFGNDVLCEKGYTYIDGNCEENNLP